MSEKGSDEAIQYISRIDRTQMVLKAFNYFNQRKEQKLMNQEEIDRLLAECESKLLPYQIAHFYTLIEILIRNGVGLDASDTGTGKTYVALAIAKFLNLKPFIVCPLSVVHSWKRAATHFNLEISVSNYESAKLGKVRQFGFQRTRTTRDDSIQFIEKNPCIQPTPFSLIIFDEVHRCKNKKTKNFQLLNFTVKYRNPKNMLLMLSATAIENSKTFRELGYFLNMYGESDYEYYKWTIEHKTIPFFTLMSVFNMEKKNKTLINSLRTLLLHVDFRKFPTDQKVILNIHRQVFPRYGSRMKIADLEGFPENLVITDPILAEPKVIEQVSEIYDTLEQSIRMYLAQKIQELDNKMNSIHILVKILRARQQIELLKIPIIAELVKEIVEEGYSVVVFLNFIESINQLVEILNTLPYSIIRGGQSAEEREEQIRKFQANEIYFMIVQIRSGSVGISLHDLNGRQRYSIISPNWSAQDLIQTLGRIHRAGAKTKAIQRIIYFADTIEEQIADRLAEKINNISLFNDGDLAPINLALIDDILSNYSDIEYLEDFDVESYLYRKLANNG